MSAAQGLTQSGCRQETTSSPDSSVLTGSCGDADYGAGSDCAGWGQSGGQDDGRKQIQMPRGTFGTKVVLSLPFSST